MNRTVSEYCSACVSRVGFQKQLSKQQNRTRTNLSGHPAVESSIAVEDAVENRGLYRIFVSRLF